MEETKEEMIKEEEKSSLNQKEEKFKRVIVALIVGAIMLMVILLGVMVYQLISIGIKNKEIKELENEISNYRSLTDEEKEKIDAVSKEDYFRKRLLELGLEIPDWLK